MFYDVLTVILLTAFTAFLSLAEAAVASVEHRSRSQRDFIIVVQVLVSFITVFTGIFAAQAFLPPLYIWLEANGIPIGQALPKALLLVVVSLILSYVLVVFGTQLPKRFAEKLIGKAPKPILLFVDVLSLILTPFVKLSVASVNLFSSIFGISPMGEFIDVTEQEIRMLVDVGGETGSIDELEKEMINNIFEFDDMTVEEVATHRTDLAAIDVATTPEEIVRFLSHVKFSRIPVYEDTIDNIIGILNMKDLLHHAFSPGYLESGKIDIRSLMRKPYFVPRSKKTDELFEEMQKNKVHMSIVVDEYGGTVGIVTMEDLIEEVMGNIMDEHDVEERPDIAKIDDCTFILNGLTSLDAVAEYFDTELPTEEYDTLSGFVIAQIGRIPEKGERPEIEFNGLVFKVREVEEKRIDEVIIFKS